jgi:hypothetical protein
VDFRLGIHLVHAASQHKAQVGDPVEIADNLGVNLFGACQCDASPLSAPGNRPGQVEQSPGSAASRKNEALQRCQGCLAIVDLLFESLDVPILNGRNTPLAAFHPCREREVCADAEQVILHPMYGSAHLFRQGKSAGHSQNGVQLVDTAVGFYARGILGHTLPTDQARGATITGFGVDPRHMLTSDIGPRATDLRHLS